MASAMNGTGLGAATDLGLGGQLAQQRDDETEDEKRRKKLGLGTLDGNPLGYGMTGVASVDLGMGMAGAGRG